VIEVIERAYTVLRELPLGVITPVVLFVGFGYSAAAVKELRRGD